MIFISPKGMTITEWINEKHRLNTARGRARKGKPQKRTERAFAKTHSSKHGALPFAFAMTLLTRVFSRKS